MVNEKFESAKRGFVIVRCVRRTGSGGRLLCGARCRTITGQSKRTSCPANILGALSCKLRQDIRIGEAVLIGLGGCFMSHPLAAARARNIEVKHARADVEGDMADAPSRFAAIRISVSAQCNPPEN